MPIGCGVAKWDYVNGSVNGSAVVGVVVVAILASMHLWDVLCLQCNLGQSWVVTKTSKASLTSYEETMESKTHICDIQFPEM